MSAVPDRPDEKYSIEELEGKFPQWEGLMRQLFMRKR